MPPALVVVGKALPYRQATALLSLSLFACSCKGYGSSIKKERSSGERSAQPNQRIVFYTAWVESMEAFTLTLGAGSKEMKMKIKNP